MPAISSFGRSAAELVMDSAAPFNDGLAASIARQGSGTWQPGPLWDAAILDMREKGGYLAQHLAHLKRLGPDLVKQLSPEVRNQYDAQLVRAKRVLDGVQTDRAGEYVEGLTNFGEYGAKVAAELKELLAKADEANAPAAGISIKGVQALDWDIAQSTPTATSVVRDSVDQLAARSAGGG